MEMRRSKPLQVVFAWAIVFTFVPAFAQKDPGVRSGWDPPNQGVELRLGVLLNPYTSTPDLSWQPFISEPFNNTIAVVNLIVFGTASNQVFGLGSVSRISSNSLNLPVDLAAVQRDVDNINWASNTKLDDALDFYVANRSNNTIVRLRQDGSDPPRHSRQQPAGQCKPQRRRQEGSRSEPKAKGSW
jgi:hypothetical protein